jgi:hypothetical protein
MFNKELAFFIANQKNLVKQYRGKILVIIGEKVIGVYPDPLTAYIQTQKKHKLGSFMIQPCIPGPEAYTIKIASTKIQ